jgi:hypothetical protein
MQDFVNEGGGERKRERRGGREEKGQRINRREGRRERRGTKKNGGKHADIKKTIWIEMKWGRDKKKRRNRKRGKVYWTEREIGIWK